MPTDPQQGGLVIGDPVAAMAQAQSDTTKRLGSLERQPVVQTGSGAPTNAVRDGTLYVDTTGLRLYVRAGGAWKSTAIT